MTAHRFPVDVLVIVRRDGMILLTERAGGVYMAGSWAVPGGKVEAGETVEQAAVRELVEEVGIQVRPADVRFVGVTHHCPPHGDARVGFAFLVDVAAEVEPVNQEPDKCSALAWADPRDLPGQTMPYTCEVVRLYREGQTYSLHGWR